MPAAPVERKLAAIFAADIAGYSRLMARDEMATLAHLKASRAIVDGLIASHRGRIFNTAGDSVVADFASAVDAVECAVAVQAALAEATAEQSAEERLSFRIGVHVGDVIVDGANLLGDGVNIAARLEALAAAGGVCISGAAREQVANKLPLGYDDLGEQRVKNMPHPVRVYRVKTETPALLSSTIAIPPVLPLPEKPSIAVLPFQNMSGDPEQEYFVDGMVEEIITALSRIRWLFVIARNSSFTYKGQTVDVKLVAHERGVRYVLEGSVRKSGNRVRITGHLIDAESGTHLWADHFDGSLDDVFELQDEVASNVAGVIEPSLQAAETTRSANRPTTDLTAYDLYLRAYAMVLSSAALVPEALGLLEQAIMRDPHYGSALAWAGLCCVRLRNDGTSKDPQADACRGTDWARRALAAGGDDPSIVVNAAFTLAHLGEDIGATIALVDRALALNPSFARGWHISGILRNCAGRPDVAIEHLETALRLSPRGRFGLVVTQLGFAYFLSRRFEEAVPKLLLAIQDEPNFPSSYRSLAACYAHMGRLDDARAVVARLRAITPVVIHPDAGFLRNAEHRELYLSGLRLAAGEAD